MVRTAVGLFIRGNLACDEAWCCNRGLLTSISVLVCVSTSQFQMVEEDLFFPGRLLEPPPRPRSTTTRTRTPSTAPLPIHHQPNGLYHDTKERWSLSQDGSTSTSTSAFYNPFVFSSSETASVSTLPVSLQDTDTFYSLDSSNPLLSDSSPLEPGAPLNPRDHTLLEYIYTGMHAARFINLSPLSLLAHSLPLYFESLFMHLLSRDLFLAD
jgi:hypothetical protein